MLRFKREKDRTLNTVINKRGNNTKETQDKTHNKCVSAEP